MVALKPHTTRRGFQCCRRASASCTCTPRLLPISSCHSSTITVCTRPSSAATFSRVSIRLSVSGVVTSPAGMRLSCRARSALGVSPVRWPTDHAGNKAGNGSWMALVVSAAKARIGVSHSTCSPGCGKARCKAPSHTASVLPLPVVACSKPLWPAAICAQTSR